MHRTERDQASAVLPDLWNAGSILPDRTTTTGLSLCVTTISDFQIL
jgi:hypothetical protein